ncbi:MAG TPA: serine/threonine-protein kinase, partial [Kofleriaceae bacterium]|nr:serine/threonine-protein kinase [Kofleriaceae bacterium]
MERSDLTGAILDGRYRVLEPVAEGAMGIVYRAERVKLGRIVAIKVLHDALPNEMSARKRFEIEAVAMAKLEHPHCASVLDVGIHGDRPYVVMDFVHGQNLRELIANGPVVVPRAVEIVRQVLSGLAHAHELGIIHRDIKPANLVLSQKAGLGDHVKILDFGLARLHDTGQNLTTGLVVGTPAYMAPEQIRGLLLDHRADLYACGVLLFELLTGQKPFHSASDDPIEVCKMHLSDPIPRLDAKLPGVDFGELEAVVAKALAKQPSERFASAQEYATALDAVIPHRPSVPFMPVIPATPLSPPGPPAPTMSIQITSADVIPAGDVSYPPSIEIRSADAMSVALVEPSRAGTAVDPRAQTVAVASDVLAASLAAPPVETASPPTFLGIAVTPPSGVARRMGTSPSAVARRAETPPLEVTLGAAPPPPPVAATRPAKRRRAIVIGVVALITG